MQVMSNKPKLGDIRSQQYVDVSALAASAGVSEAVLTKMLNREPVLRYQAELVLAALSDETGEHYSLETVDIVLVALENEEES